MKKSLKKTKQNKLCLKVHINYIHNHFHLKAKHLALGSSDPKKGHSVSCSCLQDKISSQQRCSTSLSLCGFAIKMTHFVFAETHISIVTPPITHTPWNSQKLWQNWMKWMGFSGLFLCVCHLFGIFSALLCCCDVNDVVSRCKLAQSSQSQSRCN